MVTCFQLSGRLKLQSSNRHLANVLQTLSVKSEILTFETKKKRGFTRFQLLCVLHTSTLFGAAH